MACEGESNEKSKRGSSGSYLKYPLSLLCCWFDCVRLYSKKKVVSDDGKRIANYRNRNDRKKHQHHYSSDFLLNDHIIVKRPPCVDRGVRAVEDDFNETCHSLKKPSISPESTKSAPEIDHVNIDRIAVGGHAASSKKYVGKPSTDPVDVFVKIRSIDKLETGAIEPCEYLNRFSSVFVENLKSPVPKDPLNLPMKYNVLVTRRTRRPKEQSNFSYDYISKHPLFKRFIPYKIKSKYEDFINQCCNRISSIGGNPSAEADHIRDKWVINVSDVESSSHRVFGGCTCSSRSIKGNANLSSKCKFCRSTKMVDKETQFPSFRTSLCSETRRYELLALNSPVLFCDIRFRDDQADS